MLTCYFQVLFHPAYNVYITKCDLKNSAFSSGTTKYLLEQLMLKIFGNDYITSHSSRGQRKSGGGNPASDVEANDGNY